MSDTLLADALKSVEAATKAVEEREEALKTELKALLKTRGAAAVTQPLMRKVESDLAKELAVLFTK